VTTNQLLDRLPAKARASVLTACVQVELVFPQVLEKPGDSIRHAYFPTESFISLVRPMGGKHNLEVSLAGDEGLHGVALALGVDESPVQALVQGSGLAWRMEAAAFRRALARLPDLRGCVDRYIYVLLSQLIRTAGCNRFHVVEQRLARWLLMTADRTHASTFRITHEFLAYMLGVRRVGITQAASALHDRNLIAYQRGIVAILDRRGLERAACSCYRADIATYNRVFG
jgi:CRP-like cAMP-binding protein